MKDRLIIFLKYLKIGQAKFEKNVGLANGFVNNIGKSMNVESLLKIEAAYPELNSNWLKTGEGEMLKPGYQQNKVKTNSGIVGIQGAGHSITNSDVSAIKEVMSPIVSLMEKKDEQVSDVITMLKSKDDQVSEMISILKSKDEQINRLIGLVERHGQ